jgi:pimeloyl-ACP methyl ester carboxylesterase
VESPQGRIAYLTAGEQRADRRPTLLLIHGSGVSARYWAHQIQSLSRVMRVVAIDLPGHGESDSLPSPTVDAYADATRSLLEALDAGPVFAAGHSLGGAVALALAARHPEAVRGLVLLSACAKLPAAEGSPSRWLYWFLPGPLRKIVFFSTAKKLLFGPGAPKGSVRLGMEELRRCRPHTIQQDVAAANAMDLEDAARGARVPALILCGSRDRLTPPVLSQRLHELIAGSRLEIVPGAGHMLLLEAPDRVSQAIQDFVESVAPPEVPWPRLVARLATPPLLRRLLGWVKASCRRG